MISGIAGRSMVSEKNTVRSVLLSSARVNHALRPTVIGLSVPPPLGVSLFSVRPELSTLRIFIVRGLALFIVNGNKTPNI
jgi:hypothetical protein